MSQLLTLSRAAQLLGVSRHVLQRQIRDGQLAAYDGMVASEELQRLYPDVRLGDAGIFYAGTPLAGFDLAKCGRERILPRKEVLSRRLTAQSEELAEARKHLARYHDLVEAMQARIAEMAASQPSPTLATLGAQLEDGLAAILGSQEAPDKVAVLDEVLRVVAAHVTVRPSGHEFFVEGAETVLEAALRAGLAPSYGCGNGNCGLCKARVVEGELKQVRDFDYPLSAVEQAQNYKLLCCHTAATDLVVEMVEAMTPADIPEQQIVARVKRVTSLDARTFLLHLETPRTNRLRFLAGQSVTLGIGALHAHCRGDFAIASCPCDDRNLWFHVSRSQVEAGNAFAARLFDGGIHVGDSVDVGGPFGEFVLHQDQSRPLLFVCCDTGFAPVKGIIEHALSMDTFPSLALVWAATRPDGHYLAQQGRAWGDALDNFRFEPVAAASVDAAAGAAAAAALDGTDATACDAYLAGPRAFVEAVVERLRRAGLPAARLFVTEA